MHKSDDEQGGAGQDNPTIGAVSRALGVPAPTIRAWEWRYQLPTGRHRPGGQRRYSAVDVAALTRMRDEIAAGRGAAEAAALVTAALAAPPATVVDRLVAATHRLHTQGVVDALEESCHHHGLPVTLEQVVLPALQEIGRRWADGRSDVAHEHLLAGALQGWLAAQQLKAGPPRRASTVVLACGPDDQHTLALEAFAVLLTDQGFDCRYLGAQTPISSLVLAARQPPAHVVVVASHLPRYRTPAVRALQAVAALPVAVFYAGAAFDDPGARRDVPGTYLDGTLSAATRAVAQAAHTIATTQVPVEQGPGD
ncbi:B12 binding domain-containing protein [Friedmanniella luteola]|uniref:B12 binding domain-containing protein n=2 Tax=Friedmanniella luteola TaxID=546871 RepID=A0A1H1XMA8_9ACTN|nr:B12 binding domain-containing protein [Friedmanniella luteola]